MRIFIVIVTFLGFSLSSIIAQAQDHKAGSVTVPISYFHDLITVPVYVNDTGPHLFILDTGSTQTVLYENFLTQLQISQNGTFTKNMHGIHASEVRPELTETHFRIGDFELGTVFPVATPAWEDDNVPSGIIGTDLLKEYGVIIDSDSETITFATADAFKDLLTPSWKPVRLKINPYDRKNPRGLLFVNVDLNNGTRIPAIFDTGSQITMMNPSTVNEFFKGQRISNGQKTWSHKGALASEYVNKFVRIPELYIRSTKWKKTDVLIKDMFSLDVINKRRRPLMIVGMDLMENRDFAINFADKWLYMSAPRDIKTQSVDRYSFAFNDVGY